MKAEADTHDLFGAKHIHRLSDMMVADFLEVDISFNFFGRACDN